MAKNTKNPSEDPRRRLPAIGILFETPEACRLVEKHTRPVVLEALQKTLASLRQKAGAGDGVPAGKEILAMAKAVLDRGETERLRPVVNATGVILHTGLGRAVLPGRAVEALSGLDGYCNLQLDLESGARGDRNSSVERLVRSLTGAEAALVVNNNAAATLLMLAALCPGREVVVSRGQLIEIGGSFRLPDCVSQSGAVLVEVGTTNKTHLRDYERAIGPQTAALLRVNPSNYRIVGFAEDVPVAELAKLAHSRGLIALDDLGCGALVNLEDYGLPHEPTVGESIRAGADVVCFSGDKLISGPQAGIIAGKKELVERISRHPLSRMLRVGKLTVMALEETLRIFLRPERLTEENPVLRMLCAPVEGLRLRAKRLAREISAKAGGLRVEVKDTESSMGGGSLPGVAIPSFALALSSPDIPAQQLSLRLRLNEPPVIARIEKDEVLLDLRTVHPGQDAVVAEAVAGLGKA